MNIKNINQGVVDRLDLAWKNRNKSKVKTKTEFEKLVDVSHNTAMRWFRVGNISDKYLKTVAKVLDVDHIWLLTGHHPTGVREHTPEYLTERDTMIAVYDVQLSAGNGMTAPDFIETKKKLPFDSQWLNKHNLKPDNLMVLYVAGDSMLPTMEDGDSVLIDKSKTKIIDRKIYGIVLGGDCKIKRLSQRFDGSIEVLSDNPMHKTEVIPATELEYLHIIGQAVYRSGML